MEIAQELGLWERVQQEGWYSISNADCGRVGGLLRKRLREKGLREEAGKDG